MQINQKILDVLKEFKINQDDALCYLISLYHGYTPSYIPEDLKKRVNLTGIVSWNAKTGYEWKLPFYSGVETAFEWVKTEYVPLFKSKNPQRGGKVREATGRMKKLFADNPEIRKEDVIGATKMYLRNTDAGYIRFPHFFIQKDKGLNAIYDILDWIEKYKLANTSFTQTESVVNKLQ